MALKTKHLKITPFYDPERDGVTQGILGTFQSCRQAARESLSGWRGKFPSYHLVYGSLAHYILDRAYTDRIRRNRRVVPSEDSIKVWFDDARKLWIAENPVRNEVTTNIFEESFMKNCAILPPYFKYWRSDFLSRKWVNTEHEFNIPWQVTLPSGRVARTRLRGKIDGLFQTPSAKSKPKAIRIMETKNRTQIAEEKLVDTMPMDRQTRMYVVATKHMMGEVPAEVELNIIRKTSLRQSKKESWQQYEQRIRRDVQSRLDWYFVRMSMSIHKTDVVKWEQELNALIADFLAWWYGEASHYPNDQSCYQYGRPCDFLRKCSHNDSSNLYKRPRVFTELEDVA